MPENNTVIEYRVKKLEEEVKTITTHVDALREHITVSIKDALNNHYTQEQDIRDQVKVHHKTIQEMPAAIASAVISEFWIGILGQDMSKGEDGERHKRAIQEFCRNAARFSPYVTQGKLWIFIMFIMVGVLTFGKLVFELIRNKLGFPSFTTM